MSSGARISRIGIVGASGRMGREILALAPEFSELSIVAAFVSERSESLGQPTSVPGLLFSAMTEKQLSDLDGVIDFSNPEASIEVARLCAQHRLPLLVGTTGFTAEEQKKLSTAGEGIPLLLAPNTSVGVCVLGEVASLAQRLLGSGFDIEIAETHHREKKDAPSGTARSLAERLAGEGDLQQKFQREGKRITGELGISSLRGGGVFGDHTIYFFGNGERLELTHRAEGRTLFARGALTLFLKLQGKAPGFYRVRDLIVSDQPAPHI